MKTKTILGVMLVVLLGFLTLGGKDKTPCITPVRTGSELFTMETRWYFVERLCDNILRVVALEVDDPEYLIEGYGDALACAIRDIATTFFIEDIKMIDYSYGFGSCTKELYVFVREMTCQDLRERVEQRSP